MRLSKRVKELEQKLTELQREVCTHPAEELITDIVSSKLSPHITLFYRIKCKKCGEIIKYCASMEELLHEKIHILKEQIENLPDKEEEDE